MSEQTENWQPYPLPDPPAATPACSARFCIGAGAPDDANGPEGGIYVNSDNGNIYTKSGGVWTLSSTGSSSTTEAYYISTPGQDPNGVVSATRPAIAYDNAGAVWIKTGSGTNNTGWEQRL